MRSFPLSLLVFSSVLLWTAAPAYSQVTSHPDPSTFKILNPPRRPPRTDVERALIQAQAQTGSTIPLWTYSVTSPIDSNTYSGSIVGRNPYFHGHRSTTIQTYVVPIILTMPNGDVFDPTTTDSCLGDSVIHSLVNSPIYSGVSFTLNNVNMGVTQYPDAYQRGNFWSVVSPAPTYHTLLGLNQLAAQKVTVPSGHGYTQYSSCEYGVLDYNWFDSYVRTTLIPKLTSSGVGPTNVPIFVFDSVVMYLNSNVSQCCALGDHGSYTNGSGLLQTYIVSDFDTSGAWEPDVSILSHEVTDWMNDPTNTNVAPAWRGPYSECETAYEVAEPLAGYIWQIQNQNNVTYNLEEITFFSWFYRQSPSIGVGQLYSDQGQFTSHAGAVCH